ncbi:TPA: hypothetical protein EYN98_24675 [Candidatus Poribacteria bacterium]|nr:hypothetical protein [Candidatus Poribacteria bacterium]HIN75805.1 hypothetical protein [Rhodospirillales bacterium]HIB88048.1 hypothetical protein [Candidatus Poribacteria bacterium]HIC01443.1 hypothetical protein [Candidatus Poribacteria bacterium]HIO37627.1 hypothetical protein [Rhodospirillales bacterium]
MYRTLQIYTTDIDKLLQIAESRVTHQLAVEEKRSKGYWIGNSLSDHELTIDTRTIDNSCTG